MIALAWYCGGSGCALCNEALQCVELAQCGSQFLTLGWCVGMGCQWTAQNQSGGEKNGRAVVCSAKSGWENHHSIPLFVEQWRDVGEMSASGLQTIGTLQLPVFKVMA